MATVSLSSVVRKMRETKALGASDKYLRLVSLRNLMVVAAKQQRSITAQAPVQAPLDHAQTLLHLSQPQPTEQVQTTAKTTVETLTKPTESKSHVDIREQIKQNLSERQKQLAFAGVRAMNKAQERNNPLYMTNSIDSAKAQLQSHMKSVATKAQLQAHLLQRSASAPPRFQQVQEYPIGHRRTQSAPPPMTTLPPIHSREFNHCRPNEPLPSLRMLLSYSEWPQFEAPTSEPKRTRLV